MAQLTVEGLGTAFHAVPKARFDEEFKKVAATDEVRAMAEFYTNSAKEIVEPTQADRAPISPQRRIPSSTAARPRPMRR